MRSRTTLVAALALSLCMVAAPARAQSGPVFTAEDMLAMRTFAGGQPVAVSSTGRWIAYVLTDRDDEWNVQEPRPTGHVHVVTLAGGRPGASRGSRRARHTARFPSGRLTAAASRSSARSRGAAARWCGTPSAIG
jgi:hypothetical protein